MNSKTLESADPRFASNSSCRPEFDKNPEIEQNRDEILQSQPPEYYDQIILAGVLILLNDPRTGNMTYHTILLNISENYGLEYENLFVIAQSLATLFWNFSKNPSKVEELSLETNWTQNIIDIFLKVYEEFSLQIVEFKKSFLHSPSYYNLSWRLDFEIARRNVREINLPIYMIRFDLLSSRGKIKYDNNNNNNDDNNNDNNNYDNKNNNNNDNSNYNTNCGYIKNNNNDSNDDNDVSCSKNEKAYIRNNRESDGICDDKKYPKNGNSFYPAYEKIKTLSSIHLQCDYANLKKMEMEIKLALNSCKTTNSQTSIEYVT